VTEIYVPADPLAPVQAFLGEHMPPRYPGIRVAQNLSRDWSPSANPELVLFDDSGPMRYPVETLPTVRVTVWAAGRDAARDIAGHALGLLLCVRIPGVAKVLPHTSLIDDRDDKTGGWLASFTVRTRMRTTGRTV
jgi:hypothetical protein